MKNYLVFHAGTNGKVKMTEATRVACHTHRKTKEVFQKHGNEDIDKSKTKDNIDFEIVGYEGLTPDEVMKERLENEYRGKRKLRSDAVVYREVICNPSSEMFANKTIDEQRQLMSDFYDDALPWFQEEFGEKNVIGASAHFDESSPHLHLSVMPMTNDGRMSQKDFFKGPADLKRQHREFRGHMIDNGWDFERENKYAEFHDVPLENYKENAEELELVRMKNNKTVDEIKVLSEDKDVQAEAFNLALQQYEATDEYSVLGLLLEEIEEKKRKAEEKERKAEEMEQRAERKERLAEGKDLKATEKLELASQMLVLASNEHNRNKLEKPTLKELQEVLQTETDRKYSVYTLKNEAKTPVLVDLSGDKPIKVSESDLIRDLSYTVQENDRLELDLEGSAPISYVLGHYLSKEPKTAKKAHLDGLETITKVHIEIAAEMEAEKSVSL